MYYLLLVISLFLLIYFEKKIKINNLLIKLVFSLVLILLMLRYPIGSDVDAYRNLYLNSPSCYYGRYFIFGYIFRYASQLNVSFTLFITIFNVLCLSLLGYTLHKFSKSLLFSLLIFLMSGVCLVYFNSGFRQIIAMLLFLYAYYEFLENNKIIPYFILCVIGSGFHEVAYVGIMIGIFKLLYQRFSIFREKWLYFMLLCLSVLFQWFSKNIVGQYAYLLGKFSRYFTDISFSMAGLLLRLLLCFVVVFIYLCVKKKRKDKYTFSVTVYIVSTLIYIAFSNFSLISRVSDFVAIVELILIPNMLKDSDSNIAQKLIVLVYLAMNFTMMVDDMRYHTVVQIGKFNLLKYPYVSVIDAYTISDNFIVKDYLINYYE